MTIPPALKAHATNGASSVTLTCPKDGHGFTKCWHGITSYLSAISTDASATKPPKLTETLPAADYLTATCAAEGTKLEDCLAQFHRSLTAEPTSGSSASVVARLATNQWTTTESPTPTAFTKHPRDLFSCTETAPSSDGIGPCTLR